MNTKITLVELARLMAESTSTSTRMCELFLRDLFATVSQALINGESVKIKGIGTFRVTAIKPRKSVNVTTGETMEVKGYSKVTFTPDKSLAEAVNQPFAQFETVFLNDEVSDEKLAEIDEQYPSLLDDISNPPDPAPFPEPDYIPQSIMVSVPASASASKTESHPQPASESEPDAELKPASEAVQKHVGKEALAALDAPEESDQEKVAIEESAVQAADATVEMSSSQEPTPAPSAPVAASTPEPEEDDGFRRPEPRNAYTPTQEQISRHQSNKNRRKLWWLLLAALAVGLLCWLFTRGGDSGKAESDQGTAAVVVADSDSVAPDVAPAAVESAVITDTVTSKIVLSTLSDKYYDSPWFWVYIYEENKAIISDPDNVPPGTAVVIPPAEKYGIDAKDPASLKKAQRRSWEILTQGKR